MSAIHHKYIWPGLICLLLLSGLAAETNEDQPEAGAQTAQVLDGQRGHSFLLEVGTPIFMQPVQLEIVSGEGATNILVHSKSKAPPSDQSKPGHKDVKQLATISHLQKKGAEYVYGRLRMHQSGKQYRCKVWQRDRFLFLRVYDPYTYHTFKLQPDT